MNRKSVLLVIVFFLIYFRVEAQQNFVISGHIRDGASGEDLPGASVLVLNITGLGTVSNSYGFYSLSLQPGKYKIRFQYIGFEPREIEIELSGNQKIDIELSEKSIELGNETVEFPDFTGGQWIYRKPVFAFNDEF